MNEAERFYEIGGVRILVRAPYYEDSEILKPFRCADTAPDTVFDFRFSNGIRPSELPKMWEYAGTSYHSDGAYHETVVHGEGGILMKVCGDGRHFSVLFDSMHPDYFGAHVVLKALALPELMLRYDALFLHASMVIYDGRAILFTADKQVGKSTQASLWEKHLGARIVNGDRALVRRHDGIWRAFGSPYCGTSSICNNAAADIAAVVILGQAKETTIRRAGVREALQAMMSGVTYNVRSKTESESCLELCGRIVTELPFYRLDCTPDITAVNALLNAITEN